MKTKQIYVLMILLAASIVGLSAWNKDSIETLLRATKHKEGKWDGERSTFTNINVWGNRHLNYLDLSDITFKDCIFTNAHFEGESPLIKGTNFKNCTFIDTDLICAHFDYCLVDGAKFLGSTRLDSTSFRYASLIEAEFCVAIGAVKFDDADLTKAILRELYITQETTFDGAILDETDLRETLRPYHIFEEFERDGAIVSVK